MYMQKHTCLDLPRQGSQPMMQHLELCGADTHVIQDEPPEPSAAGPPIHMFSSNQAGTCTVRKVLPSMHHINAAAHTTSCGCLVKACLSFCALFKQS